jgi:type I restriction enzyme S subunit
MSRIDQLIAELCPDGVTFKELGDACLIKTGQAVNKIVIQNNPGDFPVINSGREPLGYINTFNVEDDPIGITSRGAGVGSITWCDGKYFRGNLNYSSTVRKNVKLVPRFLYHYLMGNQASIQQLATYDGIPALNASNLKKLRIPIPPLEIQREIVKVLDTFTQLEAELEAELEARRRQYQYYRDALLGFDAAGSREGAKTRREDVRWATLGEIGKVSMCKRVFKNETSSEGEIPFYKIGTFGGKPDAFISRELFDEYRGRYSFPKKGDVLISAAGTIGRAIPYDGEDAYFQDSNIVWIDNDESLVTNKYLWHWYQIVEWATDGGTIQRLYNENLRQTRIAIPPLEEQQRIVAILDKFDALVNDLSSGLPAEIKARRQQYEHYRDRLLSFREAA